MHYETRPNLLSVEAKDCGPREERGSGEEDSTPICLHARLTLVLHSHPALATSTHVDSSGACRQLGALISSTLLHILAEVIINLPLGEYVNPARSSVTSGKSLSLCLSFYFCKTVSTI